MGRTGELEQSYSNNGRRVGVGCCSYKRTTVLICSVNILVALYVFHNLLYQSIYSYSYFQDSSPSTDTVESWRIQKLEEAKKIARGKTSNPTIQPAEAGMLVRALESSWTELSHEIGLWIPVNIINNEHDDKPEGEDDFDDSILAGRRLPPECNAELHTDYGGHAVKWGLTHRKESAYECCQACINQAKAARPDEMKCNIWVYCPAEGGCHSPDIYQHKLEECWLKYAEEPKVNFKNKYSENYRRNHPNAPLVVPWVSGVISS
ncbi:hypothetical protein CTI12_AA255110 [Artemisia annua]|uniref:Uncharacterized protein n=1 Tax=Artemisia annua TaxID=35608 RepID=A0A2U1NKV5_ARTAN|nr:hypothetical protein CTI12_AA255110 [Artemisia annua]